MRTITFKMLYASLWISSLSLSLPFVQITYGSQLQIILSPESQLDAERYFLGDIARCEGQEDQCFELKQMYLGRVPPPGEDQLLERDWVARQIGTEFPNIAVETLGPEKLHITAKSIVISKPEISDLIESKVNQLISMVGDHLRLKLLRVNFVRSMVIRPTDYELDFVNFDRSPIEKLNEISGRRVVEIQARETKSGKVIATTKASVVIDIEANVLVARKQLTSMTLIEHQDLEFRWLPLTKAKLNDQQSIASVVGRAPKQTIQTGQQIRLKNLILPAIVGRGQMVRLRMLRANGIEVNAEAKAMSAGSIGENVKVYYAATKKTLSATVTGAGQVEVRL